MNKNNIRKLCALSAVLVSVQLGSVLSSNSYNASATMGSRVRRAFNSVRGAFNSIGNSIRRSTNPARSTRNLTSSRDSLLDQNQLDKNKSAQGVLNKGMLLGENSALVQTPNPRHSQIKQIPGDAKLIKTTTNSDGVKMTTGVSEGNYFTEASKEGKIVLRSVRTGTGSVVTEWFAKDSDYVVKREIRTQNKIITTKFLEDGSSEVEVKDIQKVNK